MGDEHVCSHLLVGIERGTTPSRAAARQRAYQQLTECIVARINERFGKPGKETASLLCLGSDGESRTCVASALGMSHAALVNSSYDGLKSSQREAGRLRGDHATLLHCSAGRSWPGG